MKKIILFICAAILLQLSAFSQSSLAPLTVEKIMRDPSWIGTSPSSAQWNVWGDSLFFMWNPDKNLSDSLYFITLKNSAPQKANYNIKNNFVAAQEVVFNADRTAYTYSKGGDIFYVFVKTKKAIRVTATIQSESNPVFSFNDKRVVYTSDNNLYSWNINTGETEQLTNLVAGNKPSDKKSTGDKEAEWMKKDQLSYLEVLNERKQKKDAEDAWNAAHKKNELTPVYTSGRNIFSFTIDGSGRYISYRLFKRAEGSKNTIIPDFVTESGYTEDIRGRTKVGAEQGTTELYFYDREKDTVYNMSVKGLPGIDVIPSFLKDYFSDSILKKENRTRAVSFSEAKWSPAGSKAFFEISSLDHKDRWLMLWEGPSNKSKLIDKQQDDAWISGPNISSRATGWIDNETVWYQSETSGYSHVYVQHINSGKTTQLTKGNYEVQRAMLSNDKKTFYLQTNEVHPGEQQLYSLNIASGKTEKLTAATGANDVSISPDEKKLAILYSYATKPWELYLQDNKAGAAAQQITNKAASAEFLSYPWRDPEVIRFPARDGAMVYARLYKPANATPGKPAVVFVHGAGYLQNAHKWWSNYFREFMFNNMLADNGYYVLDIDYRASAGYGSKWRTGIYRFMGGKDLDDQEDGIKYLVKNYGVNEQKIGMYGGSYGGFITLMAMFTKPDLVAAGAALRPVTDWANYNHGYTSNILNQPFEDSIAYRRSSPIYHAAGLKNHLLICHGMVDVNVHYQDVVKLTQRLIELHKDNWELASYPMEDHGFKEPSSWTDEYKRIFKLFETVLK